MFTTTSHAGTVCSLAAPSLGQLAVHTSRSSSSPQHNIYDFSFDSLAASSPSKDQSRLASPTLQSFSTNRGMLRRIYSLHSNNHSDDNRRTRLTSVDEHSSSNFVAPPRLIEQTSEDTARTTPVTANTSRVSETRHAMTSL